MAYVGDSSNFDLDDDGILRDSMSGTDLLIDDDGILRDDDPDLDPYKHVTRGHWTDSGIGGDKQSSSSTLQHLQNSWEEDLPPIGDESINISEFEASKDDLSFDRVGDDDGLEKRTRRAAADSLDLMDTMGSTLDKPDTREAGEAAGGGNHGQGNDGQGHAEGEPGQQLFTDDYYRQLRDLGVLVDGVDLSRDSLNEFEELESRVASRMDGEIEGTRDLIGEYLASEYQKEKEEQEEDERDRDEAEDEEERRRRQEQEGGEEETPRYGAGARDLFGSRVSGLDEGDDRNEIFSRASSARTISSRSFPGEEDPYLEDEGRGASRRSTRLSDRDYGSYYDDYDDDKENVNLSQNLGSQGGSQSQRTPGEDDDEIYHITSRMLPASPGGPKPAKRRGPGSGSGTPKRRGHSPLSGRHGHREENDENSRDFDDARSVQSEAGPYQRPTSASSHVSTASELVSRRQRKAEEAALNRIASARSQESFFQQGKPQDADKGTRTPTHKRLLPQPSGASGGQDLNHSFKVKSKSSGSISNTGPVRPTHSSVKEISKNSSPSTGPGANGADAPIPGRGSTASADRSMTDLASPENEASGALSDRLTQEAQKRKQATELVQQLQKDYDNLLTKYALAELTIDQMRLDGRVTIHTTDSPTPGQATSGVMSPSVAAGGGATVPQVLSLRQSPAQQGVMMRSSPASVMGHTSPFVGDGAAAADTVNGRPPTIPGDQRSRSRGVAVGTGTADSNFMGSLGSSSSLRMSTSSVTPAESEDGLREFPEAASTVKGELMTQARVLDERLETFWNNLNEGQLTLEQQEQVLDQIKGDHDKLRRTYLQAKDDYNVLRRSGVVDKETINFDQNKELEGQLFRLGMRFDEVHETVESNLKERPAQRQPFQTDNNNNNNNNNPRADEDTVDAATPVNANSETVSRGRPMSWTSSLDATQEAAFELRMDSLREEYNDNMDAYRKLKYNADSSPEGERQIEGVVKRLNEICTEMPDMFRLSPEIQARWQKLNRREQEAKNQRRSPVPPSPRSRGARASPVDGRPPSILRRASDASDVDSIRARLDGSRSSLGSILPDRMDRPPSRGHASSSHRDRPSSRASNRSSRAGTTGTDPERPPSRNRASPTPSLPRPRKHAHELKDPKLSQMPDMKLPRNPGDAGASGGEGGRRRRSPSPAGAVGGAEGALAALPGPGKFKQMMKQRGADDADSGFLGSMVGSGVGAPTLLPAGSSQQSLDRQAQEDDDRERTLRLRQRTDESSTITDNSMDTSSQAVRPLSSRNRSDASQEVRPSRGGRRHREEESYDGEEDTMEALDSETGGRRHRGGGTRRRSNKDSSRDISLDVTLEEQDSIESDVSTPRAPRGQAPTLPQSIKKRSSGQQASANQEAQSPVKPRRPSSRAQTASETEEELRAINNSKIRSGQRAQREDESKRGGVREEKETVHRTRLKSPPPPPRPSSRGSPTTDLYHTRGRHSSGESRRSGTSSRRGGHREATREERQEEGHVREEIRQTQQGPRLDRPSSRQGRQRQQQQQQQQQQQHQQNSAGATGLPPGLAPASDLARRVKDYEERSAGSSDVEVGSSVTRASSVNSSNRLKALQEEIEKLKEGVARANEKASRPAPQYPQVPPTYIHSQSQQAMPNTAPPPAAAATNKNQSDQQPEFYDPFDDPYGFMRMPRRRANSFSGGRERDWGEWYWNLPQNRQEDGQDIPLGYAAADAYAENAPQRRDGRERNTRESVKERMRQRRQERKQREEGQTEPQTAAPMAGQSAQDPQTQALYDYYVPQSRFSARGMRSQLASRGYFTTPTGAKIYSSTGEDADLEGEGQEDEGACAQHWFGFQQGPDAQQRPWYQIRRAARPLTSSYGGFGAQMYPGSRLTQSQEDVRLRPPPPYGGYITQVAAPPQPRVSPTSPRYARTGSPVRGRSRSVGRSHSHTRYKVREYTSLSDSDDERRRPRSRSMSRGRSRSKSRSKYRSRRRYSSDSISDQSGDERAIGLDRSLSLSQDISRLTKKMLGTLKGELRKSKVSKREFGSSYW